MPMEGISICAQTLFICLIWMWEAVWVGYQTQPWCNFYHLDTSNDVECQNLDQCMCLIQMWEAVCSGYQPPPWCNGFITTLHWPRIASELIYSHEGYTNVIKHFVSVWYGCGKQSGLDIRPNYDAIFIIWTPVMIQKGSTICTLSETVLIQFLYFFHVFCVSLVLI